ncbi:NGFI-A-binding protein 1a isoform X1 [Electrophorus electricus]|nr:NGFI-A-binding protein 1a isoform X1 [Electrophorus electricus]
MDFCGRVEFRYNPSPGDLPGFTFGPGNVLPCKVCFQDTVMASLLPRSVGELQLYRVLQRANLLCYYGAFVQQGGDDVQQLCEAAEDEFLEIMALVGMATKPLHVRRLQKALRDWVTNPTLFNQPLTSLPVCSIPVYKVREGSPARLPAASSPSSAALEGGESGPRGGRGTPDGPPGAGESRSPPASCSPASSGETAETLDPGVAEHVSECVERLAPTLLKSNPVEVKERLRSNRRLSRALSHLGALSEGDPRREAQIRKHSAIYRHLDRKREDGRQLTTHELVMNEAAALLCLKDEALLTQREQLFSLARQISREVTYRHNVRTRSGEDDEEEVFAPKRIKIEDDVCGMEDSTELLNVQQESLRERLVDTEWKGDESIRHALQVQLQLQEMLQKSGAPQDSTGYVPDLTNPSNSSPGAESPQNSGGISQSIFSGDIPLGRQLAHELKQHLKHRRKQNSQDARRRHDRSSGAEQTMTSETGTSPRELCLVGHMKIKAEPEEPR